MHPVLMLRGFYVKQISMPGQPPVFRCSGGGLYRPQAIQAVQAVQAETADQAAIEARSRLRSQAPIEKVELRPLSSRLTKRKGRKGTLK